MISELVFEYIYPIAIDSNNDPTCVLLIEYGDVQQPSIRLPRSVIRQLANDILTDIASVEGV